MKALCIDPGSTRSALVGLDDHGFTGARWSDNYGLPTIVEKLLAPNAEILEAIAKLAHAFDVLAIEQMRARGMPTANEELDTVEWSGRFIQRWCDSPGPREWKHGITTREREDEREATVRRIPRAAVKLALCGSVRARDSNIRAALLDLYGGKSARGCKAAPGPLYKLKADLWSALAVGVTALQKPT